jgi:hypothetical protein
MTLDTPIRVRKSIKQGRILCKAIKLYPSCSEHIVYSSIEKEEEPILLVKRVWNERLKVFEIEVVFLGGYHVEKPSYYRKPKSDWISFAEFVLTPEEALKLGSLLTDLSSS